MRKVLVLLLCLGLIACSGSGRRGGDAAPVIYDFGAPAARLADAGALEGYALEVRAPLWFDSLGITYRLAYADPSRLRDYTRARWAGPPAQLIQQRLMQRLMLVPHGQARTQCVLRIEIDEFSQVFDTANSSRGVLQGRLVVLDRQRGRLAAEDVKIEKPAASADAPGGVAALIATVDHLAGQLPGWVDSLRRSKPSGACGS
ncbi:MAG: ABC-type transport auxiliary lipoprotein family protein [Betaproteobacteria bacterium]